MSGATGRGFGIEEHDAACVSAALDLMRCVGGHSHLPATVSGPGAIDHRQRRLCSSDLHGAMRVEISGADRPGKCQHTRTQ